MGDRALKIVALLGAFLVSAMSAGAQPPPNPSPCTNPNGTVNDITKCPGPVIYKGPVQNGATSGPAANPGDYNATGNYKINGVPAAVTVNGTNCPLGGSCSPSGGGGVTAASLGIFLPTNFGPPSGTTALVNNLLPDGGTFGDGLAHPASSNGYATLGALQAAYSFATATSNDMAGLMIQAAINAADASGFGTAQLFNGQFRTLPSGWSLPANTNAKLKGNGVNTILLCQNAGTNPCTTVGFQYAQSDPVSHLTMYGLNTFASNSPTGGAPATNIYIPGSVGLKLFGNNSTTYTALNFFNFDMPTDFDTVTGGNYLITFRDFVTQINNRGDTIPEWAPNSFERMTWEGGASANNNYNGFFVMQTPGATIASGTYNPSTGAVSLTTAAPHALGATELFSLSGMTGTGNFANLNSTFTATSGTTGSTINFTAQTGLTLTITGGNVNSYGAGSELAYDIHVMNRSYDYPNVLQLYAIGNGALGSDHLNAIYMTSMHIETSVTATGSGCRMSHDSTLDLSQTDWFEDGANATGAVCHLTANSRTWVNGGKGPGFNSTDAGAMPFIVSSGAVDYFAGGVGLGNRVPTGSVLISGQTGDISGYKAYDPAATTLSSATTLALGYQEGPLRVSSNATITIPLAATSPLAASKITQIMADPGVTATIAAASGATVNGGSSATCIGTTPSKTCFLTNIGTNTWSLTQ
jgi:hypothetical protein